MKILNFFLLCLLIACSSPAQNNGLNTKFLDENIDVKRFEKMWKSESREVFHLRHKIFKAAGLKSGMDVADIGTGPGVFIPTFLNWVGPKGSVTAVDISPKFLENIKRLKKEKNWTNVYPILGTETSPKLKPNSMDFIFLCDTYHHFDNYSAMLKEIKSSLRPGGILAIVDFEKIPGKSRDWIMGHVRAAKGQVIEEVRASGLQFVGEKKKTGLEENYLIVFKKK